LKKINDRIVHRVLKTPPWHSFGEQFRIEADGRRSKAKPVMSQRASGNPHSDQTLEI
jgi:hypothetical protein